MESNQVQSNHMGMAIVGALLAALIGGIVWAAIAIITKYELGFIAWGIGGLAGYAVVLFAKEHVDRTHQVIAVIASLLGILLGKYFILAYIIEESVSGIFRGDLISFFFSNLMDFFGTVDIIFVLLAVVTAWQLPERLGQGDTEEYLLESEQAATEELEASEDLEIEHTESQHMESEQAESELAESEPTGSESVEDKDN